MFWKLTEKVWWGDCDSVSQFKEVPIGGILNVCSNNNLLAERKYNPICLDGRTSYFRMGRGDREFPDDQYFEDIESLIRICFSRGPILVHCFAGMHRSPAVATIAAMIEKNDFSEEFYASLTKRVGELNPDAIETEHYNFRETARRWSLFRRMPKKIS